jgi:hypothetical protein
MLTHVATVLLGARSPITVNYELDTHFVSSCSSDAPLKADASHLPAPPQPPPAAARHPTTPDGSAAVQIAAAPHNPAAPQLQICPGVLPTPTPVHRPDARQLLAAPPRSPSAAAPRPSAPPQLTGVGKVLTLALRSAEKRGPTAAEAKPERLDLCGKPKVRTYPIGFPC